MSTNKEEKTQAQKVIDWLDAPMDLNDAYGSGPTFWEWVKSFFAPKNNTQNK